MSYFTYISILSPQEAAGGGASAALAGSFSTASAGTLVPTPEIAATGLFAVMEQDWVSVPKSTRGQQIDVGQGTVVFGKDSALTGRLINLDTGTIGYVPEAGSGGEALAGSATTFGAGAASSAALVFLRSRKIGGGSATFALSGVASEMRTGLLQHNPSALLNGPQISLSSGAFLKQFGRPLSGHPVSASSGLLSILGATTVNTSFTLQSTGTVTAAPFTVGHAFAKGEVLGGVVVGNANAQITPKNYWPDGSVKFAIIAGTTDLTTSPKTITLTGGTSSSGTAITTSVLTGVTASITTGAFGSASWNDTDWGAPFQTWVSGHRMSSWVYRKQIGTDAHLVGWLEVRAYAGGNIEVLPWVENGYVTGATGRTNKNTTYSFTLNGATRFASTVIDLKFGTRTPLLSGSALSYWTGTDPNVRVQHNAAYLMSTEMVPTYQATTPSNATAVTRLKTTFTPLDEGDFAYGADAMSATGAAITIGLLPEHDVVYLTSTATTTTYPAVIRNGYCAGRWGLHYREPSTNRPPRFSSYASVGMGDGYASWFKDPGSTGTAMDTPTGGAVHTWATSHSPSVGYMAYLVTGRYYFMEQVQFVATANYLGKGSASDLRDGVKGLVKPAVDAWQTRSAAWMWRDLTRALAVTPDDDATLRPEFINSVQSNIDDLYNTYVGQANNTFGFIQSGTTAYGDGTSILAPWQQDFFTGATGHAVSMELPVSSTHQTRLSQFFQWTANSIVGRMSPTDGSGFPFVSADVYALRVSGAVSFPNYITGAGPWYSTWAQIWSVQAATLTTAGSPNGWLTSTGNTLAGEIMPGSMALWGNLQPAISYAVRHSVTGAEAAYNRMVGATNWSALASDFNTQPVWSVKPKGWTSALPAWLAGQPLNTWIEITGTSGAGGAAVDAFCGMALKDDTAEIFIAAAGGHFDSSDNRVVSIRIDQNAPSWTTRMGNSASVQQNVAYYPDGKPSARHTYQATHYIESLRRVMLIGTRFVYGTGVDVNGEVNGFNIDTNQWDAAGTWPNLASPTWEGVELNKATGQVWMNGGRIWTPTGVGSATVADPYTGPNLYLQPFVHDPTRNTVYSLQWANGQGSTGPLGNVIHSSRVNLSNNTSDTITLTGTAAAQLAAAQPAYAAMEYDADNDRYLFMHGGENGKIYVITPNSTTSWPVTVLSTSGTPTVAANNGINDRFRYVPKLKGFVYLPRASSNLWFIRTA